MQSSQVVRALPVVLCLARPFAPLHQLFAQERYRVNGTKEVWLYQEPGGKRVARVLGGTEMAAADSQQKDWRQVLLDGWIFAGSVGPSTQPGFDLAVTRTPEENLRAAPAGTLVARLPRGFLLSKVGLERRWVHVRRTGWLQATALEPIDQQAALGKPTPGPRPGDSTPTATPTPAPATAPPSTDSAAAQPARRTALYRAPEGPPVGVLAAATPVRVLSRSGEWSRVQFEGWVKTADLETAAPGVLPGVTGAEVRADPQRYVGQTLRWRLQFIAVEKSDELRPDIPVGSTYLLTRGPLPERGFVYVVLPEGKGSSVAGLAPLAVIDVVARVRSGRSRYIGVPILDLVTLEGRAQP